MMFFSIFAALFLIDLLFLSPVSKVIVALVTRQDFKPTSLGKQVAESFLFAVLAITLPRFSLFLQERLDFSVFVSYFLLFCFWVITGAILSALWPKAPIAKKFGE